MKILLGHNFYREFGGEDFVFNSESDLILNADIELMKFSKYSSNISSLFEQIICFARFVSPFFIDKEFKELCSNHYFDVAHFHNIFPLISPSLFDICHERSTPVIMTLHNFRTLCPTATLMSDAKICERSLHDRSWWAVPKRVYRNSLVGTAALAYMVEYHKRKGTWQTQVDRYIALTEFAKKKFIEGGLPAEKISVKPNFIEDPFHGAQKISKNGGYALFVGRLSEEKGLGVLLDAWQHLSYPLKIVGDGPLKHLVEDLAKQNRNIEFLGFQDKATILPLMQNAEFLIMTSICYEGFPMVLLEAFASSTSALVSNIGGMAEIVSDGITGLHFQAGSVSDLVSKAEYLISNKKLSREMGDNARLEYLKKYTPELNFEMLLDIYRQTIREKKGRCPF